ncbi:MAG: universal stress protein [Actinomycetota bacterium]|nr:universal stress protein [Actinomycetota bacterium]
MSIFPTKILLATDGSEQAELAARTATDLAGKTSSELHVVHVPVLPPEALHVPLILGTAALEELERRGRARLDELVGRLEASGGAVGGAHFRVGSPAAEIVAQAEELGAGLVVLGSRGLGAMRRVLMGSVSDSVVRHAPCPTLVVRGEPLTFPTKILLATDGSEEANLAASTAAELAKDTDSELHVIHVGQVVPTFLAATEEEPGRTVREARRTLDEQVQRIEAGHETEAQAHLRYGGVAEEVVALAEDIEAGLIAMGSRGRGGIRRALMGSVSERVVRHAHCAVLVVRS